MINCVKAHNFVDYKYIGWRGGGESLTFRFFRPHVQWYGVIILNLYTYIYIYVYIIMAKKIDAL